MNDELPELSQAFGDLLDEVRAVEQRLLTADPPLEEADILDGYRWALSLLRVAAEAYIWGDSDKPILVDVIGPYLKWGGDNSDAFYQLAPIDPSRSYRVTGNRGDSVYLSMTVYGGPDDGRYSDRIIDTINDRDLGCDAHGNFEFVISAQQQQGNWLKLEPDAVFILTRDYLTEPGTDRRVQWRIEALDDTPRRVDTRADLSRRMRAARTWIREQAAMVPVRLPANALQDPYPVPSRTVGWAAGDAAYSMGAYELQPGQALLIEGTSPECVFWNLCLWNPFLHTYDYTRERVTINGAQVSYRPDGSWQIVISDTDPGHPNWVSTAGRAKGLIWLRWFLPEVTPDPLNCRVVDVAELAS
ncbi:hypothetical protein MTER_27460 [Mycolicibacter terrae]|uniref:DUF1214 domain-containing protein n=1 Tax=Mycolicibacter terrae TaxID=1788 RepID=A0AAD1MIN1_9MYCO|nr:DUF1214 domain-containing protein [Mycolicibacter terrae]ORW94872.1 hypothetical protein AWC28_12955 [Mycolicibacter terrae]BBX23335.1 hypothetical protein MTER_27460 [Mycolicibacter terrae]SNV65081.1 Protein of uncharacterised function (DUF1214) [Mycolicibacter terrae]